MTMRSRACACSTDAAAASCSAPSGQLVVSADVHTCKHVQHAAGLGCVGRRALSGVQLLWASWQLLLWARGGELGVVTVRQHLVGHWKDTE